MHMYEYLLSLMLPHYTHYPSFCCSLLLQYDQLTSTISDFSELAVGFGYTTLFVAALPIAASFFLVFGIIQVILFYNVLLVFVPYADG